MDRPRLVAFPLKKNGWWIYGAFAALVLVLSISGWFSKQGAQPGTFHLWAGVVLALLPVLYYSWILGRGKAAPALRQPGAPLALLLLVHAGVQLSGGLRSPLLAVYALTIFAATLHAGRTQGLLLALVTVTLESLALLKADLPGWNKTALLIWGLTPFGAWLISLWASGQVFRTKTKIISPLEEEVPSALYLSQVKAENFDPGRYLDESVDAMFSVLGHAHPSFNALILWWLEEGEGDGEGRLRMYQRRAAFGQLRDSVVIESGDGLVGYVLKENKHIISEALSAAGAAALPYYTETQEVQAFIGLPLHDEGKLVAVLTADKIQEGDVGPGELEALQALGHQVVREAQQVKFTAAAAGEGERYEGLYSVGLELGQNLDRKHMIGNFQQMLGRLVPYDSYYLALREGETGEGRFKIESKRGYTDEFLENFNLDEDTAAGSWVFHAGEILRFSAEEGGTVPLFLAEGLREKARSFLLMPLMSEKRVIGLLKIDRGEKVPFDKEDEKIAAIFSGQAAIALENARLYSLHLKRATTDGLTSLYNHRYFQERLASEMEKAKVSGEFLSLALTDIDFFKKFNDSFGHQEGDRVLKKVAALLQDEVRPQDVVCRYGGEEFVVIMPSCDLVEAREVMERVRKACEEKIAGGNDEESRGVTLSIGLCVYPKGAEEQRRLIHLADAALYVCKDQGRNRVASYRDLPPTEFEKSSSTS